MKIIWIRAILSVIGMLLVLSTLVTRDNKYLIAGNVLILISSILGVVNKIEFPK